MKTSTAEANGYRCPECRDDTTHDLKSRGFVRHRSNATCHHEAGERDDP